MGWRAGLFRGWHWRPRHPDWGKRCLLPLMQAWDVGPGPQAIPKGWGKGRGQGTSSWDSVGRFGRRAQVPDEILLVQGTGGPRARGMNRGTTRLAPCPDSATILLCNLGQVTLPLWASVSSVVSLEDLRSYPVLGFYHFGNKGRKSHASKDRGDGSNTLRLKEEF